jgi:MFS family permease
MSSTAVASAKIVALVIGSVALGYLLSRARRTTALFAGMVLLGLLAQALIFLPIAGIMTATGALILWIFAFGGMAGGAMALLPLVVKDPARSGAASGLVNQFISAASFAAPSTWLALHDGPQFVALAAACLVVSFLFLPKGEMRAEGTAK